MGDIVRVRYVASLTETGKVNNVYIIYVIYTHIICYIYSFYHHSFIQSMRCSLFALHPDLYNIKNYYPGQVVMSTKNVLGRPWVEFVLGVDQVIKGFDRALPLMSVGERSTIVVTSEYACKSYANLLHFSFSFQFAVLFFI